MKYDEYIFLLQNLIKEYSPSGKEEKSADLIEEFFKKKKIPTERIHNNVVVKHRHANPSLPLVILNSHHDTVAIGNKWTKDPLGGEITDGRIYGRGSNDAGGSLISLIAAFCNLVDHALPYNLMLIASGEEENSGENGVRAVLDSLALRPRLAIVGEPTDMNLAVAEKGLIVIDGETTGSSGHAARDEGVNAIYSAIQDVAWIKNYKWDRVSDSLGSVKTTVTQIESGTQHNVIPDRCTYVVDCRVNDLYTLEEVVDIINQHTVASIAPRSLKWKPSSIDLSHPIVLRAKEIGINLFGSDTLSDQVHFTCPSVKIGPGRSQRSHTADEFIKIEEISEGIDKYIALLRGLKL